MLHVFYHILYSSSLGATSTIASKKALNMLRNIYLALEKTYHLSIAGDH